MSPAFVIAGKDLRQRFRDRSAIILGFVAPLAIAALMSVAFRGTEHFHMAVGVVDADRGSIATAFRQMLGSKELHDLVTVRPVATEATASKRVHSGKLGAAFVIPAGFTRAAAGEGTLDIRVLTSTNSQIAGQVAQSLAESFVAQVNADRLSVVTALGAGAPLKSVADIAARAATLRIPEQIGRRPTGSKPLTAISYYAPAMAIFFVMFAIGFASRSFFSERREGMLDRIAAAPIGAGQVLLGKVLSVFVYGTASLLTVLGITSLFFGADWGNPLLAVLLCTAMTLAVVALTAFVIAMGRTEQQAQTISSLVVFGLAVLGGNFVPVSSEPALMRKAALLTPNGWALRGFVDLTTGAGTARHLAVPIAAIVAFAVGIGGFSAVRARRLVVQ